MRGKTTATLRKSAGRMANDVCFSLAAEGKTLDFAVPPTLPDDGKSSQVRDNIALAVERITFSGNNSITVGYYFSLS